MFDNVKSDLDKSIITTLINFSNDEIVEAKKMIENTNQCTLSIETILNNLNKYYEIFYPINGCNILLEFFDINRDYIEKGLINKGVNKKSYGIFYSSSFIALVYVDRINYSLENYSLICNLYKEIYKLRIKVHFANIPELERDISRLSNEVLKKISKNYEERDGYNSFNEIQGYFNKSNNQNIVEILQELKDKNTEINEIEKKYIEYLIEILRIYYLESKEISTEKLKNEIFIIAEQIKKNKKNRSELTLTLQEIEKNEKLNEEYAKLKGNLKKRLHDILSPLDFPLEKNEDLEWRIELWKEFDKKGIAYYEHDNYYTEDKRTLSQHYKEFVDKGFKPDEEFEEILKKANKDIFQN